MTERETRATCRETESRSGVNPPVLRGGGFCGFDGSVFFEGFSFDLAHSDRNSS